MAREFITEDDILASARAHKVGSMKDIDAVVLEANGGMSIVLGASEDERSTLKGLH